MSVEKHTNGYLVRWRDTDGRQRAKVVARQRDAYALDGEIKRKKAMGELLVSEKGQIRLMDFWEIYADRHLAVHVTARARQVADIAWRRYIRPALGRQRIGSITVEQVAGLVNTMTDAGLSAGTVSRYLTVLQGCLSQAVRWGYLNANPADEVRKPQSRDIARGYALSVAELDAVLAHLEPRSALIVRLLADSGLRPGELRALTWADITRDRIIVDKAVSSNMVQITKTGKRRAVVLRDDARAALYQIRNTSVPAPVLRDRVVPGARGPEWTDDAYRLWAKRTFRKAAVAAGLPRLRVYDLRHTFVSRLIDEGQNIYWIAQQAGHDPAVALRTYAHLLGKSVHSECNEDFLLLSS